MNLQNLMKQAQMMQQKMSEVQNKMENTEVTGSSGGGLVECTANAKGDVKKIKIDLSLIKTDEVEILEDLIIAAINDVKRKADEVTKKNLSEVGMPSDIMKVMG